jgi:hypothetical protein
MTENGDKSVQLQLNFDDPTTNDKLLKENIQLHKQIAFLQSENKRLNQMLNIGNASTIQHEEICEEHHSTI